MECPRCATGRIVLKQARDGRSFFGCNSYPRCTFSAKRKPIGERCGECSNPWLEEHVVRGVKWARCPVTGCRFEKRLSQF
ncbi:MAG: topoisomerase DNA-binding C4 zinc finger domain-containing protein [Bryobacter sp.]|nr:topoisomerase DNA-binding C4 zinc finger domain-containing protein [Bryobacter sp. CoA8 C33]